MNNQTSNEEWVVERCSSPFNSSEEAVNYMKKKNFGGMVLQLEDGSIQAVCRTYPDGFYPNAKILEKVNWEEESCC